MSYATTLKERLEENLSKEYATPEGTAGFVIPPGLLELLIPLILNLLQGCLGKNANADPTALDSVIQWWVVNRAVRKTKSIDKADRSKSTNAIIATLKQSSQDEVKGLMQEIQAADVDWDLFD